MPGAHSDVDARCPFQRAPWPHFFARCAPPSAPRAPPPFEASSATSPPGLPPGHPAASQLLTAVDAALVDRVLAINPNVRRLNVSKNAIAEVTHEIGRLAGTLLSLDVSHNRLRSLPLSSLPALESVYASHNAM